MCSIQLCTERLQIRLLGRDTLFETLFSKIMLEAASFCFVESAVAVTRSLCFDLSLVYWWSIEVDAVE
jgi:hypothetical protein